jgi:dTDP-4-amino-4,6-dideoxygalactose transaminase
LPERAKLDQYIDKIYTSGWLTNRGSLLRELEQRLAQHLGVKHLVLVANGSLALQVAYKALELTGEVITTPFSFAATTSTLAWEGLNPVFADIDRQSFNLDPKQIANKITDKTSAIVPVHVFGNPCQVVEIERIAKDHNLKVIYDAAHAFDVYCNGNNVLNYGDISTLSFHATKLFHTIEGGAIITNDDVIAHKVRNLINFGITGPTTIESLGTNAKMNEFEAAMGLCVLDDIEKIKAERRKIWLYYKARLETYVVFQSIDERVNYNYSYVPILLENETQLLKVEQKLKENEIIPRRYFYPSLDTLDYVTPVQFMPISRDIASRILCLPTYSGLTVTELDKIIDVVLAVIL